MPIPMLISMAYISLLVFERLFLRRKTKITLHKRGELLDRFAALELLDWCEKSILPEELSYEQQDKLLAPLNALGADYEIIGDGMKHYIYRGGQKRRIYAYPAMWSEYSDLLPVRSITLSDKILKYALPQADAKIRNLI